MTISKRPCQICGKPIGRLASYTCSAVCAGVRRRSMTKKSIRLCTVCNRPIGRRAKYTCSTACAGVLRTRKHDEEKNRSPMKTSEWSAWMADAKPFAQHECDPGDGYILRLPGPDPERSRGLLGSSAAYAADRGSGER